MYVLVLYELVPSNIYKHICGLLTFIILLDKSLVLLTPHIVPVLASFETQRRFLRRNMHETIIKLDPMRLAGIGRGIHKSVVVAAVVGLPSVNSHTV
jgi:hypothetical protein